MESSTFSIGGHSLPLGAKAHHVATGTATQGPQRRRSLHAQPRTVYAGVALWIRRKTVLKTTGILMEKVN